MNNFNYKIFLIANKCDLLSKKNYSKVEKVIALYSQKLKWDAHFMVSTINNDNVQEAFEEMLRQIDISQSESSKTFTDNSYTLSRPTYTNSVKKKKWC